MTEPRGKIDREALRAHGEWTRRGRQGDGRLDVRAIDASASDLRAARLAAARLEGVDLRKTVLDYADLTDADLIGCNLDSAGINSTHFDGARITNCSFQDTVGEIAKLERASVTGSRFDRARLHVSQWTDATVKASSFAGTALSNATLDRATFVDCDFRGAWLGPTRENPAHSMRGASFVNCDFRGADFTRAKLDGATFDRCKFEGARGEPSSLTDLAVSGADIGTRDQVITALEQSLDVDAILRHPGPLVAARDVSDPLRTAVFVVGDSARILARVPLDPALDRLRKGATYGRSGIVWSWQDDTFTVWDSERKAFEARGKSLSWPGGPIERDQVTGVRSFINPERRGNRGVRLVMPSDKYGGMVIVQDNDFAADNDPSYSKDDARRDGMWASHLGRYLAEWLGIAHDDELA